MFCYAIVLFEQNKMYVCMYVSFGKIYAYIKLQSFSFWETP